MKASTLWLQSRRPNKRMLELTVGNDREIDARLLRWDILGSLGHVEGLRASGLLSAADHAALRRELRGALAAAAAGRFAIGKEHEDVHSAVEAWLTRRSPRAGAMLHTARSRNDQIACDVRLFLKGALLDIHAEAHALVASLFAFAVKHRTAVVPGYTHTRKAMPSSFALWASAHAAGLIDTLESLPAVWAQVDRSPLGSAAGYGVPVKLDRKAAARALGFAAVQSPVTAIQNGRGKLEAEALFWCVQLGHDAAKVAADVIQLSADEFGFLTLDRALTTGSSLMPHKRNPDLFELARARAATIEGDLATILALRAKLTSGYHRDFQMLKEPLFRGLIRTVEMIEMLRLGVDGISVDRARCAAALTDGVHSAASALELAAAGVPFRDAYRTIARAVQSGDVSTEPSPAKRYPVFATADLSELRSRARAAASFARRVETRFARAMNRLAGTARA